MLWLITFGEEFSVINIRSFLNQQPSEPVAIPITTQLKHLSKLFPQKRHYLVLIYSMSESSDFLGHQ